MGKLLLAIALSLVSCVALAGVDALTSVEATSGLREALAQGAEKAVMALGTKNGFFKNKAVHIPLPDALEKGRDMLDKLGQAKSFDDLELAMNRAAEAAVPEAKALLSDAITSMSVQDAKEILTGGDTAATDFFRKATKEPLTAKFLPIVRQATAKVDLANKYNAVSGKAAALGLLDRKDANVEEYVTRKALDGLYRMIAAEERKIRKNPVGQASKLLQKVFGSIG